MLAILFTSIFMHGYIPSEMIDSVLVPIIKNKAGELPTRITIVQLFFCFRYAPKYWKE